MGERQGGREGVRKEGGGGREEGREEGGREGDSLANLLYEGI